MADQKTVAVLRVFDIQDEDGPQRHYVAEANIAAAPLEPGNYELVLRRQPRCAKPDLHPCDCRSVCKRGTV